jgi:ribose transport system ATP-binding protein
MQRTVPGWLSAAGGTTLPRWTATASSLSWLGARRSLPSCRRARWTRPNQHKVSLAKWLAAETEILIIDEATIGIDV